MADSKDGELSFSEAQVLVFLSRFNTKINSISCAMVKVYSDDGDLDQLILPATVEDPDLGPHREFISDDAGFYSCIVAARRDPSKFNK